MISNAKQGPLHATQNFPILGRKKITALSFFFCIRQKKNYTAINFFLHSARKPVEDEDFQNIENINEAKIKRFIKAYDKMAKKSKDMEPNEY